jgi:hypothetical protein
VECSECRKIKDNMDMGFYEYAIVIPKSNIIHMDERMARFTIDYELEKARDKFMHYFGLDDSTFEISRELER